MHGQPNQTKPKISPTPSYSYPNLSAVKKVPLHGPEAIFSEEMEDIITGLRSKKSAE